jgi:diacylglycerol kinase (CTP)
VAPELLYYRSYMTTRANIEANSSVQLHVRHDLHLARKAWHMMMGLILVGVYLGTGMSRTTGVIILSCFLGFDVLVETIRLRVPSVNEKMMRVWQPFMRSCEVNRVSGIPYYIAAALIAVGVFPKPIAALSILFLAFGDPMASLVGILYGKNSLKFAGGKSLVGTAAGVLVCMSIAFALLSLLPLTLAQWIGLSVIGGLAGGTAELLPVEIDDNFTIPVVSGFVLWLAMLLMGV